MSRSARYLPKPRQPRREEGLVVSGPELLAWKGGRILAMDVLGGGRYRLHLADGEPIKRKETR